MSKTVTITNYDGKKGYLEGENIAMVRVDVEEKRYLIPPWNDDEGRTCYAVDGSKIIVRQAFKILNDDEKSDIVRAMEIKDSKTLEKIAQKYYEQ